MQLNVKELINEGAYGRVYKAIDSVTNTTYAIKERKFHPKDESMGIPSDILREIVILKKLDHENIIRPVQVEIDSKARMYRVVLEYFEFDLLGMINIYRVSNRRIPLESIKSITKQMLRGVEYLHSQFIIHRDLKPSNILVDKNLKVKIADFGFAKQVGMPLRHLSSRVGTMSYKAPELLIEGEIDYGPSVDIWAIGCILINLIIRDKFVDGVDEQTILMQLVGVIGKERFANCDLYKKYLKNIKKLSIKYTGFRLKDLEEKVKDNGVDFVSKLMEPDPLLRIEAVEALAHPWLKD